MSRTRAVLAVADLVALSIGAWMIGSHRGFVEERLLTTPTCRVPITVLAPQGNPARGSAIIFHGIAASRRLMLTLGQQFAAAGLQVWLVDSPGHGDSTEPFSFSRVEDCAAETVNTLARHDGLQVERTILIGHSMGGAVAMRLADQFHAAATIAMSPAPMVRVGWLPREAILFSPPRRMPNNLLIFAGALEPSLIHDADEALVRDAGGERTADADFAEKRAVQLLRVPGDAHTSLVFDPRVARHSIAWSLRALGAPAHPANVNVGPEIGSALGTLGILLLLPFALEVMARQLVRPACSAAYLAPPTAAGLGSSILLCTLVSLAVVALLQLVVPLRFLRIFTGDYYASFQLLAGFALLFVIWAVTPPPTARALRSEAEAPVEGAWRGQRFSPLLVGGGYAMLSLLAVGAWLSWQTTDLWMTAARWWRFALLVPLGIPFYLAEERLLGAPEAATRLKRWMLFLLLRLITWGAMIAALLVFHNDQILILLLGPFLALVAIAQRAGADAVRRRSGSVPAAALFSAILGAWFVSAVLPLT